MFRKHSEGWASSTQTWKDVSFAKFTCRSPVHWIKDFCLSCMNLNVIFSFRGYTFYFTLACISFQFKFCAADPGISQPCNTVANQGSSRNKGQSEASNNIKPLVSPSVASYLGTLHSLSWIHLPTGRQNESAGAALSIEYVPSLKTHV